MKTFLQIMLAAAALVSGAQAYAQTNAAFTVDPLEKQRIADEKAALAAQAQEQVTQARLAYEMAQQKAKVAKGAKAKKAAEELEAAREEYELSQKLADQYANEAKLAALEAQASLQTPAIYGQPQAQYPQGNPQMVPVAPAPTSSASASSFSLSGMNADFRLNAGFFKGGYSASGLLLSWDLGVRMGVLGLYLSPYIFVNDSFCDTNAEAALLGGLKNLHGVTGDVHFFMLDNGALSASLYVGFGVGSYIFPDEVDIYTSSSGSWSYVDEVSAYDELAPILKAGVTVNRKLSEHLYIPFNVGTHGYVGTGSKTPFGFFDLTMGIGYLL